jgi:hypothetical protein
MEHSVGQPGTDHRMKSPEVLEFAGETSILRAGFAACYLLDGSTKVDKMAAGYRRAFS